MTTIVHTECDLCHARYRIDEEYLGKKMKCKKCGATFIAGRAVEKKAAPRWSPEQIEKPKLTKKLTQNSAESEAVTSHRCPKCGTPTVLVSKLAFSPLMLLVSTIGFLIGFCIACSGWVFGYVPVVIGVVIMGYALIRRNTRQTSKMVCPSCGWKGKRLL